MNTVDFLADTIARQYQYIQQAGKQATVEALYDEIFTLMKSSSENIEEAEIVTKPIAGMHVNRSENFQVFYLDNKVFPSVKFFS